MREMGNLYGASSWLSILFFLLVLTVAGVPPLLGFWPKLLLLEGFLSASDWIAVFALLLSSLLSLIAGARLWSFIFWRPRSRPVERPFGTAPAALLVGTIVLAGLSPNLVIRAANAAAAGLLQPVRYIAAVGLAP
jgi:multicomponent Na+:H+ antiporter subunit D